MDNNCFLCDGYNVECKEYHQASDETDKCLWRNTADSDLEKHVKKDGTIILQNMLSQYLRIIQERFGNHLVLRRTIRGRYEDIELDEQKIKMIKSGIWT